jgi:thiamine pyrophosphokinase
MRAALVGAVYFNEEHFKAQQFDCVIAVDRGYASLKRIGVESDVAVGDFDSLGFTPSCEVRTFPVEKDASDMELAMREARSRGADEVLLYGAFSARLDHTLANLQVMMGYAEAGVRSYGIGDGFAVTALAGSPYDPDLPSKLAFDGEVLQRAGLARDGHADDPRFSEVNLPDPLSAEPAADYGNFISVFALAGTARQVNEKGLKYEMADGYLSSTTSRGLSNEFTAADAEVSVGDGVLAVTFPLAAWPALK